MLTLAQGHGVLVLLARLVKDLLVPLLRDGLGVLVLGLPLIEFLLMLLDLGLQHLVVLLLRMSRLVRVLTASLV